MQPHSITAVKIFHSTVSTEAHLAGSVHKDSSGFEGNLIRQRHSRRFCLETCSCPLKMEPSRGECQALRARPEREVCNPQIHLLHLPQHLSRLEARNPTTTTQTAKKKDKRQQQIFAASRMRTSFAPCVQTGGGKAGSPLTRMEPSLFSINQAAFFHCTIARLAAAHKFLMAEISTHALTDLSRALTVGKCVVLCKTVCWCGETNILAMNTQQEPTLRKFYICPNPVSPNKHGFS